MTKIWPIALLGFSVACGDKDDDTAATEEVEEVEDAEEIEDTSEESE